MEKENKKAKVAKSSEKVSCADRDCPFHGKLAARGRTFEGYVTKKFARRIVIEFERTIFVKKYERYSKKKSKLHARLPECMRKQVEVGDYVQIKECRPLSKIVHFVLIKIIKKAKEEGK